MVRFLSDARVVDQDKGSRHMAAIAAGLPRCATSSVQAAFESPTLGLAPSMHMAHIAPHADRSQIVVDALLEEDRERRHKLLHQLFDGYGATCDFPGVMFVDDLMDMYPDAVVILNQRKSGQVWADSIRNSLAFFGSKTYLYIAFLIKTDRLHYQMHHAAYKLWKKKFGVERSELLTANLYEIHNNFVREEAAKRGKRVLEFQAEDGWKPLCDFFGKTPPPADVPFPRLNDQRTMNIVKTLVIVRGLLAWSGLAATLYAVSFFTRRWLAW
jgi:hypothetical protein